MSESHDFVYSVINLQSESIYSSYLSWIYLSSVSFIIFANKSFPVLSIEGRNTIHLSISGCYKNLRAVSMVLLEIMLTPFVKTQDLRVGDELFFQLIMTALMKQFLGLGCPQAILSLTLLLIGTLYFDRLCYACILFTTFLE